ncbi:MAG: hypothetical protein AAGA23_19660 [Pseudomonadota bacterium]
MRTRHFAASALFAFAVLFAGAAAAHGGPGVHAGHKHYAHGYDNRQYRRAPRPFYQNQRRFNHGYAPRNFAYRKGYRHGFNGYYQQRRPVLGYANDYVYCPIRRGYFLRSDPFFYRY